MALVKKQKYFVYYISIFYLIFLQIIGLVNFFGAVRSVISSNLYEKSNFKPEKRLYLANSTKSSNKALISKIIYITIITFFNAFCNSYLKKL